jgi:hypothetical protein
MLLARGLPRSLPEGTGSFRMRHVIIAATILAAVIAVAARGHAGI